MRIAPIYLHIGAAAVIAATGSSLVAILDHELGLSAGSVVGAMVALLAISSLVGLWPIFRKRRYAGSAAN